MYKVSEVDKISFILVIIGALVWLVYGLTNVNLVNLTFGNIAPIIERIIYILVGLSGINMMYFLFKAKK